ncbi:MAG TPA: ester cyclase [Anaeromyxobacter sp.]
MAVDIKQAGRRLIEEAFGKGNFDVFEEICDRGYRGHDPLTGDSDLRKAKETARMYKTAFPDLSVTLLGVYAEGDTCITHWRMTGTHQRQLMDLDPTGKRCTVEGITVGRYRGGKLVEDWTQWDALGLFKQLGVAPPLGAPTGEAEETRPHA